MKKNLSLMPIEQIENIIYIIRGQRVMLDADLALIYGVPTKRLNEQLRRNITRFPKDFAFGLTPEEWNFLRSQFATSNEGRGGRRYLPYAFTEHGAVMLANILRSPNAIKMSVEVVRAFVRFRHILAGQKELAKEVVELKSFVLKHSHKTDQEFRRVWATIDKLIAPPAQRKGKIGFDWGLD